MCKQRIVMKNDCAYAVADKIAKRKNEITLPPHPDIEETKQEVIHRAQRTHLPWQLCSIACDSLFLPHSAHSAVFGKITDIMDSNGFSAKNTAQEIWQRLDAEKSLSDWIDYWAVNFDCESHHLSHAQKANLPVNGKSSAPAISYLTANGKVFTPVATRNNDTIKMKALDI